jgi:hypothetical protein
MTETKDVKEPKPKQARLPGMTPKPIEEIQTAAEELL